MDQSEVKIRYSSAEDTEALKRWLLEPEVLKAFPMTDVGEVEDAARFWIGFARYRASLTAEVDDEAVGIATLNLTPYKKVAHQCLLSVLVTETQRNKGIGSRLLNNLIHLAKNYFHLEVLYLEVYEGCPAISLYRRFGFRQCGHQPQFMKEEGQYMAKITMERLL